MDDRPSISVLIPTFNRADVLEAMLTSVFGQTAPIGEVVLVDDGSLDGTASVVDALLEQRPDWRRRLRYLQQPNQGKSVALNNALERATGDWIAFNDSDDVWRAEKIEWQLRAFAQYPDCGACFTDARFVNNPAMNTTAFRRAGTRYLERIGRIPDPVRFVVHSSHGVFMQTLLVRKDVMARVGEFDPRLRVSQDTDFVFRLARETTLCYVNLPLVDIDRQADRSGALTSEFSRQSLKRIQALEIMLRKWLDTTDGEPGDVRRRIRVLLRDRINELSDWHLLHGVERDARRELFRALGVQFSARLAVKLALLYLMPRRLQAVIRQRTAARPGFVSRTT